MESVWCISSRIAMTHRSGLKILAHDLKDTPAWYTYVHQPFFGPVVTLLILILRGMGTDREVRPKVYSF
jgi:hypothetical protein